MMSPFRRVFLLLVAAVAFAMLAACGSAPIRNPNLVQGQALQAPDTTTASGAYEGGTDYRIGAQDLLEISVFGIDQLSSTVRVNSNGQISLPLIGGVLAGGKTIPELETEIGNKLKNGYVQDPQVTVFVKEAAFPDQHSARSAWLPSPATTRMRGCSSKAPLPVVSARICSGSSSRAPASRCTKTPSSKSAVLSAVKA